MKVELTGPDDLGYWFLTDSDGNAFPLVETHEGHPAAAAFFGWKAPEGIRDEEAIIQDALAWLMQHIGEEITAPKQAIEYFHRLDEESQE